MATAPDGRAALDLLHRGARPGLVLLDLMMPVMNGWQFREAQRAEPDLADIPVVIVSGDARLDRRTAELAGVEWLRKPLDLDVLLDMVGRHVPRAGPAGAA